MNDPGHLPSPEVLLPCRCGRLVVVGNFWADGYVHEGQPWHYRCASEAGTPPPLTPRQKEIAALRVQLDTAEGALEISGHTRCVGVAGWKPPLGKRPPFEEIDALRDRIEKLEQAALSVVQRWETPLWKDAEPTAAVIARLRDAIGP